MFIKSYLLQKEEAASVIVAGCAVTNILKNNESNTQLYNEYNAEIIKLVQPSEFLAKKGVKAIWMIQEPVETERLPKQLLGLDNPQVNLCNKIALEVGKNKLFKNELYK